MSVGCDRVSVSDCDCVTTGGGAALNGFLFSLVRFMPLTGLLANVCSLHVCVYPTISLLLLLCSMHVCSVSCGSCHIVRGNQIQPVGANGEQLKCHDKHVDCAMWAQQGVYRPPHRGVTDSCD